MYQCQSTLRLLVTCSTRTAMNRPMTSLVRTCRLSLYSQTYSRSFSNAVNRQNRYVRFSGPESGSPFNRRRHDTAIKVGVIGLGLCVAYYVAHLEQVPETGRWRFMDTSPQFEVKLAHAAQAEIHREFGEKILPPNHPMSIYVQRIVQRILNASSLGVIKSSNSVSLGGNHVLQQGEAFWNPDEPGSDIQKDKSRIVERDWEVVVINDPKVVNAAASPGIVYVFTGILPIAQDEHGLAAVLAHEIGHVVARHVPERVSSQKVFFVIASLLELLNVDFGMSKLFTSFLLELPNSRTQEREADVIGLRLMSRACYDPAAAPRMFTRLGAMENKQRRMRVEFLQTHPLSENRVKYLEELLPEAQSIVAANPNCSVIQDQLLAFKSSPMFTDRIRIL